MSLSMRFDGRDGAGARDAAIVQSGSVFGAGTLGCGQLESEGNEGSLIAWRTAGGRPGAQLEREKAVNVASVLNALREVLGR